MTLRKTGTQTVSRTGGTRFVVSAEVLQEVLGIDGGRFAWPRKKGFSLRSACPACRAVAYSRRRERCRRACPERTCGERSRTSRREPPEKATLSGGIRQTDRQTDRRKRCAKWPRFAVFNTISEQGLHRFHLPPPDRGDMPILLQLQSDITLFRYPVPAIFAFLVCCGGGRWPPICTADQLPALCSMPIF